MNKFTDNFNLQKAHMDKMFGRTSENDISKAHKTHKYLKIENGKYIYDHDKMTSKDHFESAQHHINLSGKRENDGEKYHEKLALNHDKLGWSKKIKEADQLTKAQQELDKKRKDTIAKIKGEIPREGLGK
jgi:hypothetical protein